MVLKKYWYIVIERPGGSGWRVWEGGHPLERLIELPEEVPIFWEEISEELVRKLNERFAIPGRVIAR